MADLAAHRFVERHGGPVVATTGASGRQGVLLCRDGASLGGGVMTEPPADPRQRLQARRRYHRLLLERAEIEAAKLELALSPNRVGAMVPPWNWPNDRDWFHDHLGRPERDGQAMLAKLRGIVERERRLVAELDAQIGEPVFA